MSRAVAVSFVVSFVASFVAALTSGCLSLLDNRPPPRDRAIEQVAAPTTAPLPERLRLVTYNTHGMSARILADALASDDLAGADVIVLQEIERHADEPLSRACAAARWRQLACAYAPGHRLGDGGDLGVAILSRAPLRDLVVLELPFIHTVLRSGRRVALSATVDTGAGPLRVVAVHLDNRITPAQRVRQLGPVLAHARAGGGPVVVAGDVNTSPFSWLGQVVPVPTGRQDDHLEASVRAAGLATPVTGSGPTSAWLGMRLDAVYTRAVEVTGFGVARAVRASDHLPLWADLEVHAAGAALVGAL